MQTIGLTIEDMLRLPVFRSSEIISGEKGKGNVVKYIDILEVPDLKGWVKEGEVLLTTAYSLRSDLSQLIRIVETLTRGNAAALGIKLGRFIEDIPDEVVQLSEKLHFPIIRIDPDIPWIDITYAVMEQLLNRQEAILKTSNDNYENLLTDFLEERGIQKIADHVSDLIHAPVFIMNLDREKIVSSPERYQISDEMKKRSWDIRVNKRLVGHLLVDKQVFSDLELIFIEQARFIFSLEFMKRKIAIDTELKLKGDFFDELISGQPLSEDELETKARQLNLNISGQWQVILIHKEGTLAFSNFERTILEESGRKFSKTGYFHAKDEGSRLVVFLSVETIRASQDWGEWFSHFLEEIRHFRVGIGREQPLIDAHKSYIEAKQAMAIGTKLNQGGGVYSFQDMEVYHLILEASAYVDFDKMIQDKIGSIVRHDKENNTQLLDTLYQFLACGGNVNETADHLFIHRNTVKYRLDRVREIIHSDFEEPSQRFILYLCCALYFLRK
ncbi:PucR family transcriptional regulator [Sporolactobacillus sp. THM7-7]|nr:PucR family transcriptional regulator [Sporolactobacillus sp. THM7-7]